MTRGAALALVVYGVSVAGATMAPLLHTATWTPAAISHTLFAIIGAGTAAVGLAQLLPHPS